MCGQEKSAFTKMNFKMSQTPIPALQRSGYRAGRLRLDYVSDLETVQNYLNGLISVGAKATAREEHRFSQFDFFIPALRSIFFNEARNFAFKRSKRHPPATQQQITLKYFHRRPTHPSHKHIPSTIFGSFLCFPRD